MPWDFAGSFYQKSKPSLVLQILVTKPSSNTERNNRFNKTSEKQGQRVRWHIKRSHFLKKNRLWWTSLLVASTWGSKHSSAAKLLLIHQSHTHRDLYLIKIFIMTESRQEVLGASHPAVRLLCRSKTVKQFDFLCLSWMLLMNNNLLINEIIWIQNSLSVTTFVCLLLVYLYSSNTLRRLCTFHMRAGTWH